MKKKTKRELIHEKYEGHCAYCGTEISVKEMQMDHIHCKIGGGSDEIENLNPACADCNKYKHFAGIELLRDWLDSLLNTKVDERLFQGKAKLRMAQKYGIIQLKHWNKEFYFEKIEKQKEEWKEVARQAHQDYLESKY